MPISSKTLIEQIQEIAQLPSTEITPELKREYERKLCLLLCKELDNPIGYGKQVTESLNHFADAIGIMPHLITLEEATKYAPRSSLDYWMRIGLLKERGRKKGPGRGGGTILVAEKDVAALERNKPGTGRSWSGKRKKRSKE